MKRKIELLMGLCVILCAFVLARKGAVFVQSEQAKSAPVCIVVDAGHGGDDPGKIGINDALEKDINLQIALKLQKILEQNNIKVVMTRNTDAGLYSEGATNKKAEDMQKRCKIIEDSNALFTVSIHQNSYTSPEIQGAQVFYYGQSENGKKLAEILQTALIEQVDPDNHRAAKANESYYLLKKTPTPTVIVECGFLSNPIEAELLLQDDYQDQLVNAIYTGIKTYLGDELPHHRNYSNSRIVFKNASAIWYKRAVCTLYTESSFFPSVDCPSLSTASFVEAAESFTNVTFPLFPDATPEK